MSSDTDYMFMDRDKRNNLKTGCPRASLPRTGAAC